MNQHKYLFIFIGLLLYTFFLHSFPLCCSSPYASRSRSASSLFFRSNSQSSCWWWFSVFQEKTPLRSLSLNTFTNFTIKVKAFLPFATKCFLIFATPNTCFHLDISFLHSFLSLHSFSYLYKSKIWTWSCFGKGANKKVEK